MEQNTTIEHLNSQSTEERMPFLLIMCDKPSMKALVYGDGLSVLPSFVSKKVYFSRVFFFWSSLSFPKMGS